MQSMGVRNLLMVKTQVLKAIKLAKVDDIKDKEKEPQDNGKEENRQDNNSEGKTIIKSA